MSADTIRKSHYLLAAIILIAYFAVTGWDNLFAVVCLFLFTMSPLVINVIVSLFVKTRASQIVLLCTTLAYAAWASFLFVDVTCFTTDGQAGLTLLLTAIVASPVLLIAWVACLIIEIMKRRRKEML